MGKTGFCFLVLLAPALACGGGIPRPLPVPVRAGQAAVTEYKVLAEAGSWARVVKAYGLGLPDRRRDIYFYDTPELALYQRGLVLRARADSGKNGDTTVKLRPAPGVIPAAVASDEGFKCEYDRTQKGAVYACSLTNKEPNAEIAAVAAGTEKPEKIFSGLQAAWAGNDAWAGLKTLGPIKSSSWEAQCPVLETLSFERWDLPGGLSFFEISFRTTAEQADTEAKIKAFHQELERRGIRLAADQSSKTYAAMSVFSRK
jgi:hypothetical protein